MNRGLDSKFTATVSRCIRRVMLAAIDTFSVQIGQPSETSKPAIWIDAGIHAREWIAPATAVYVIHAVSHMQMTNSSIRSSSDICIYPHVQRIPFEICMVSFPHSKRAKGISHAW